MDDVAPPRASGETDLDDDAFRRQLEQLRPELRLHCYRFTGTAADVDDLVQESMLRAWTGRGAFRGQASFRTWLYKIATNACLNHLARRRTRARREAQETVEQLALEPCPDTWLSEVPAAGPDARYSTRESVALAFLAALQLLPARQRAVLILRDVLGWEASEVAGLLPLSTSAVESALHRARTAIGARAADFVDTARSPTDDGVLSSMLERYLRAWESADTDALSSLLHEDVVFSMPPEPSVVDGRPGVLAFIGGRVFSAHPSGVLRLVPVGANGQPAFAIFRRNEAGEPCAYGVQVLTLRGPTIAAITTFKRPDLVAMFGLPPRIQP